MFIPIYILAMFCGGGILALCVSVYFDACRDARVPVRDDWPYNGFRIMRRGLKFRRVEDATVSALMEQLGYRLFYTIDKSHIHKWLSVYPVWVFVYVVIVDVGAMVDWWLGGILAVLLPIVCQALWHLVEKPWDM